MIKAVYPTEARKLGVIAATYRAGPLSIYGTCPQYCSLLPKPDQGSTQIDWNYLEKELTAVPPRGHAWSYTHFSWRELTPFPTGSVLNLSTDKIEDAIFTYSLTFPVVYAAPATDTQWPRKIHGIQFIRCPAELNKRVTCQTCGGGKPLCARRDRKYIIVFVAHGSTKHLVGAKKQGGCYATQGNCLWQWKRTMELQGRLAWNETLDPERLVTWAKSLPPGTLLRHRISGDIGQC